MIYKALAEIILAAGLVQLFPVNAGVVETYTKLPEAGGRENFSLSQLMEETFGTLPMAEDVASPTKIKPESLGVVTAATTALMVDVKSGAILFEKNSSEQRSIGSITKLMTALVFLSDQPNLFAAAMIEKSDLREGGRQHIPVGAVVTTGDLLFASLVSSDNSATAALARLSGLSEADFVAQMNARARELLMNDSIFTDPTGLSSGNRSTARDLIKLLSAALQDENIRLATEQATVTITSTDNQVYQLENTNELLTGFIDQDTYKIIGGKTGYLPEAGYCLGIEVQKDGSKNIFVVVLGSDSIRDRLTDVKNLALWAYQTYRWE